MDLDFIKRIDLINPVFIWGAGCCPDCYGPLTVMDMETTFMQLNEKGHPISEDTVIRTEGICRVCGKRIPMLMTDDYNFIPDNDYNRLEKWYKDLLYEKEIQRRIDSFKPPKDNPFMINTGK